MLKLDTRHFSEAAYSALTTLKTQIRPADYGKASSAVQSLPAYISTWGLHRLAGDSVKYCQYGTEKTRYKGRVYHQFLTTLQSLSEVRFNPNDPETLVKMENVRAYTGLNRLAIEMAREWSFWAVPVLGKAEVE
jgi:hypothetical protein